MQIDWLTTAAQIVNFLVLIWLLQRFLYRPITKAMRRRETRIEDRLAEARSARDEAEDEAERLKEERRELEESREEKLEEARAKAEDLRDELETKVKKDMEEKRATWQRNLEEERESFVRNLRRRAGAQIIDVTQRVLRDFADTDLSERIATTFVARLGALDEDTTKRLSNAAAKADGASVATGHTLGSATRGKITRALHETLETDIPVEYSEDEDVLLGLRLKIGEQTAEWSAGRHLDRLEATIGEILDTAAQSKTSRSEDQDHDDEGQDEATQKERSDA
ncbi:F0F1 ATP synthase subunit delta [Roseovarius sp. E0-M6]|uniref:F0F1 ATP synthase subunit delta n=1 Tax=Roseovarius sp. E0-M6 TaxID=3127118 RepID=UPI00300FB72E